MSLRANAAVKAQIGYDELVARDKAGLDIFWLKDNSLDDSDNLSAPVVIAAEFAEVLRDAPKQFEAVAEDLNGRPISLLAGSVRV